MLLEVNSITKSFNSTPVLNIPRLSVDGGELIGIVGNNGAGKTTFFRLCMDLLSADTGEICVEGQNVSKSEEWKRMVSGFIDEKFLIGFLTAEEYFFFVGDLYGINKREVETRLADFNNFIGNDILQKRKYINQLSKGNKQKVGIIGSMITHPRLLILDEPFNFLDPSSQIIMKELLQKYNKSYGVTILLSSHNIQYVSDICSRIIVLESGSVVYDKGNVTPVVKEELIAYFRTCSK